MIDGIHLNTFVRGAYVRAAYYQMFNVIVYW